MKTVDYYEFLQISPNADQETIHRVYRFLGARFHPDNPESGSIDKFSMLTTAYEVLSDPGRRAEYDAKRRKEPVRSSPLSNSVDFMDDLEGETNRRLAVLALLYFRRRANPNFPSASLTEIETRMGFPRDYLDFTTWYLKQKGYITIADNSDFTLTVQGVDFVETQRANIPVLNRLLTSGTESTVEEPAEEMKSIGPSAPEIVPPIEGRPSREERRTHTKDRRKNPPVILPPELERRSSMKNRRAPSPDRRGKE